MRQDLSLNSNAVTHFIHVELQRALLVLNRFFSSESEVRRNGFI